jgi:predicted nucleic acid-binding protein
MPEPLLLADAVAMVDTWLARPNVTIAQVTGQHWNVLQNMLHAVGHGAALTMDAHLACLAIEHDAEIATADEDFSHFPGLKWRNPLQPESQEK